jgi:hypothetical protein
VTSPGVKACKDGLDMGQITDAENFPIALVQGRRAPGAAGTE